MKKDLCGLLSVLVLAGCTAGGKQNSVSGTWVDNDPLDKGTTYIFKDDGNGKQTGTTKTPEGDVVPYTADLTYKLEDGKLTIHLTSMKLTIPDDAPINVKTEIAEGNKSLASHPEAKVDKVMNISWTDPQTFTYTGAASKVVTFTKIHDDKPATAAKP